MHKKTATSILENIDISEDTVSAPEDTNYNDQPESKLNTDSLSGNVDLNTTDASALSTVKPKLFKGCLNIYTSKNNVHYVLTDITRSQIYLKLTGGQAEKKVRGCEKNSLKHSTANLYKVIEFIKNIGMDQVYVYLKKAYSVRGHAGTLKSIQKLITTTGSTLFYSEIFNDTPVVKTKLSPKGGRRGRKR